MQIVASPSLMLGQIHIPCKILRKILWHALDYLSTSGVSIQLFRGHTDIFQTPEKCFFSLSDRYRIFTSNWLWIENCENVVLSEIDITMTTINKNL